MALSKGTRVKVLRDPYKGKMGNVVGGCWQDGCTLVRVDGEKSFNLHCYEPDMEEVKVDEFEASLALAGLENRVVDCETAIGDITRLFETTRAKVAEVRSLLDQTKASLDLPPFKAGQHAKVKGKGGTFIIEQVEKAFGQWLVLGHFPQGYKQYTYPASELEAA